MTSFCSVKDVPNLKQLIKEALSLKKNPLAHQNLGIQKTLGLVFLNPSLRTRLSTQKAAMQLGMNTMVINMDKESWALETREGVVMNGTNVEHVKEAAAVIGEYCDIVGLRCFSNLQDREDDYQERFFNNFAKFCKTPMLNLESAIRHPLQSLADMITIYETKKIEKPKVVLAWAPHVKPLSQAVPNSFVEWASLAQKNNMLELVIANPPGYELAKQFTTDIRITNRLEDALEGADYIYVKNWSSYKEYGKMLHVDGEWMITPKSLTYTNHAKIMHCLPVRRNLELASEVLDGPHSLVVQGAANRVWAAQAVLKKMLEQD